MKSTLLVIVLSLLTGYSFAQNNVGINTTPDPSAVLDVSATDKGLLIPRMTAAEMNAIPAPVTSLMVFNTTANAFWYWNGSQWTEFNNGTSLWTLSGTNIDVADTNYSVGIGTSNPSGKFEVATLNHTGTYGNDVATGGTAVASEEYPGQSASLAFDDTPTTYWSNNNNLPAWLGYDLGNGNGKRVARYVVVYNSVVTNDNSPNDWTFEGSDDAVSWTILDTQSGQGWTATGSKTYNFSNTTHYRYYRLNITDNKGTVNNFVSVYEIILKEEILTNHPAMVVNDGNVGIGTSSPQAQLDVFGSMRLVDGNEGNGKVMVSDASGNAIWSDATMVNTSGWAINGNLVYSTFDSVGIGTSTPHSELEVAGHIYQTATGESVFLGQGAGANDDLTDNQNVFVGYKSGKANTYGFHNTALGYHSLFTNISGIANTSTGYEALLNNTGSNNTANGNKSLYSNELGSKNTASGDGSLFSNKTGTENTASGYQSLYSNIGGNYNTACGSASLKSNTTGSRNTSYGITSLFSNTTGERNLALGYITMYNNTIGEENTAVGAYSLNGNETGNYNTSIGSHAFETGTNYENSSAFGYQAEPGASNTIRLGNSSVSTIGGYANWTNVSDGRFKTNVQENVAGLDFILKLRPVTYNLDMDAIVGFNRTPDSLRLDESESLKGAEVQIGFIAQEVEAAANELGFDFHGVDKPKNKASHYGLRYAEFVVPLVKAVQELSTENQQLVEQLTAQQKMMNDFEKRLNKLEGR